MNTKHQLVIALAIGCLQAEAQIMKPYNTYCAIYGGWGATSSGSLKGYAQDVYFPFAGPVNPFDIPYESSESGTGGIRLGVWGTEGAARNFGLAFDISYYQIESSYADTTINVIPITVMGLYRYPLLKTPDFPQGRMNPYVGVGIALVSADAKTETMVDGTPRDVNVLMMGAGLDLRAGYSFDLTDRTAVFIEYRYLYAEVEGGSNDDDWYIVIPDYYAEMETDISTHQVLAGLSVFVW